MSDVTRILNAIERGDAKASDELLPLVYEELRVLAAQRLSHESPGQTLQATALVHEAYLRLVGSEPQNWKSRGHFFKAAAEAMRRILIDNARRKKSLKRGAGQRPARLSESLAPGDAWPGEEHHLLDSYLKTLKLPTMRAEYEAIARQCSQTDASYEDFLRQVAELEVQRRIAAAIERRLKQAEFPMVKELSDYRFGDVPKLNKKYVLDLARCQFIESRTNLVVTGPPGVGKTHLAIAFGREACKRGYKVKFFTAARLVNTYLEARQERTILKLEKNIRRCDLIIVDERGYIPLDRMGAEHLFGFFGQCYEQTSLIVTTNLPFADWPQVFADDERLAGALLDRLTHHVHIVQIVGDSYRLKSSLEKGKDKQA